MSIMMMMLMDLFVTFTFLFLAVCSPYWYDCCTNWIGATDVAKEGTFIWTSDNSTVGYENWYPGQPSNGVDEDCVTICHSEHWNDAKCHKKFSYICQTPAL